MIISETPLRISFFGGGSDLPQFYKYYDGLVLSTAIDKTIKIVVNRCEPKHIRVVYSELEQVDDIQDLKHTRAKAILGRLGITNSIEICSFSDVTTRGSGLGSSSSYTVGLLNALYTLKGWNISKADLAETACDLEINTLGEPIGKQDQYAAAYGGLNLYTFSPTNVKVEHLNLSSYRLMMLQENLVCYYTGITRDASSILKTQVENLDATVVRQQTRELTKQAERGYNILIKPDSDLDTFGELLHEAWMIKKQLANGISNPEIDEMYNHGLKSGALGGKLLGAGGGGYLLFYVPEVKRANFKVQMSRYKQFKFGFQEQGSKVTVIK